jgi:hypothetical protein
VKTNTTIPHKVETALQSLKEHLHPDEKAQNEPLTQKEILIKKHVIKEG